MDHSPQHEKKIEGLLRRLHWTVLRPLATRLGGDERSLFRGPGIEFVELREYQPGDDVRMIDWNVTAREDRPFVRQSFVQRAIDAWLVVDVSASVDWGTAQCLKRDRALEFAAIAGELFDRGRNHVGALLFAGSPLMYIAPAAGRRHQRRLVEALHKAPRQENHGQTDLQAALAQLEMMLKRRSFILIISDFLVPDGWQFALGRLTQRHEVVAVRLCDPREASLPDIGIVTFEDPESGRQLTVDTGDSRLRERFRQAAERQAEKIRADLGARGVDLLELSTDEDLLPALFRFLESRKAKAQLLNRGHQPQSRNKIAGG